MTFTTEVTLSLGETFRFFRERKGLSIIEAATASGLHRNTVSAMEHGDENVTIDTINAYCKVLGFELRINIKEKE